MESLSNSNNNYCQHAAGRMAQRITVDGLCRFGRDACAYGMMCMHMDVCAYGMMFMYMGVCAYGCVCIWVCMHMV